MSLESIIIMLTRNGQTYIAEEIMPAKRPVLVVVRHALGKTTFGNFI
jgi:hypothetical protein